MFFVSLVSIYEFDCQKLCTRDRYITFIIQNREIINVHTLARVVFGGNLGLN